MATTNRSTILEPVVRSVTGWSYEVSRLDRWGERLAVELWMTVGLVSIADLAITYLGIKLGFVEINPIAQAGLVVFGFWSLVLLKGVALGVGAVNCRFLDRRRYLVPTTYILVWGTAVLVNLAVILTHA